jgi:hypothetical protein
VKAIRTHRIAILATSAFLLAAAALVVALDPFGPKVGPLGYGAGTATIGAPVRAGEAEVHTSDTFSNRGEVPVVLKEVSLINPTPGLEINRAMVAPPESVGDGTKVAAEDTALYAIGPGFPRAQLFHNGYLEAAGQVVAPEAWLRGPDDYKVVIGLRLKGPGTYSYDGYEITYVYDGEEHSDYTGPNAVFCVSATEKLGSCRP